MTEPTDEEILNHYDQFPEGYCWAPMSIEHGQRTNKFLFDQVSVKIEAARYADFIDFLFDHTKHLDHTTKKEIWNEFLVWEFRQSKRELPDFASTKQQ